jgi:CBS domain containing-hemolysin-like protein
MLLVLILLIIFVASILLAKTAHVLPRSELKRRARANKKSPEASVYKAAAYGQELDLILWLVGILSFATLLLKASHVGWWLVALLVFVGGWIAVVWRPNRTNGLSWRLSALAAPGVAWLLSIAHPVTSRLSGWLNRLWPLHVHTGVYEKEDFAKLFKNQARQPDNRIPEEDLKIAFFALSFGDKTVSQVMTPRRQMKMVAATDSIGPLLMDELHASGFSRFPVVKELSKSASPQIIGTLYLRDLAGRADGGSVRGVMKDEVYYVNESQTLRECLGVFLKTHHHLLVVVNDFEEISGVITMEDVVEQVLGQKINDEFDHYDDLRAVAARQAKKEQADHHTEPEEKPEEKTSEKTE